MTMIRNPTQRPASYTRSAPAATGRNPSPVDRGGATGTAVQRAAAYARPQTTGGSPGPDELHGFVGWMESLPEGYIPHRQEVPPAYRASYDRMMTQAAARRAASTAIERAIATHKTDGGGYHMDRVIDEPPRAIDFPGGRRPFIV